MKYFAILLFIGLVISSTALNENNIRERTEKTAQALKNIFGAAKQINTDQFLKILKQIKRPTVDAFLFTFLRATLQTKARNFKFIPSYILRAEFSVKDLIKYIQHLISSGQKVTTVSNVIDQLKPNIAKILAKL